MEKTFKDRICELVEAAGNPHRLSAQTGFEHKTITGWMRGVNPNTATVKRLAEKLGVSEQWLMGKETGEPIPKFSQTTPKYRVAAQEPPAKFVLSNELEGKELREAIAESVLEMYKRLSSRLEDEIPPEARPTPDGILFAATDLVKSGVA